MAITRTVLRQRLSELMGDFIVDPNGSVSTPSGSGGGSGTTAVDALLSYYDDDYFNDFYFVLQDGPAGSGSYEVTRVADFTKATGTITLEPDASAQVTTGAKFELHRVSPADKHNALNAAAMQLADKVYLPVRDRSLVGDNQLTNSDGETFASSAFTGWTHTAGTWTQESNIVMHGSYAFKGVASGAAAQIVQAPKINIKELTGQSITLQFWVYATGASAARIRLDWGGSSFENHDYHSGVDQWEFQEITTSVPSAATQTKVILEVADGNTAYFDAGSLFVGENLVKEYSLPSSLYRGASEVLMQVDEDEVNGQYLPLGYNVRPRGGRRLELVGRGKVSTVSAETDTMELSEPEVQILYAYALYWLANNQLSIAARFEGDWLERSRENWLRMADSLSRTPMVRRGPVGAAVGDGYWRNEWDGETGYLVLAR